MAEGKDFKHNLMFAEGQVVDNLMFAEGQVIEQEFNSQTASMSNNWWSPENANSANLIMNEEYYQVIKDLSSWNNNSGFEILGRLFVSTLYQAIWEIFCHRSDKTGGKKYLRWTRWDFFMFETMVYMCVCLSHVITRALGATRRRW